MAKATSAETVSKSAKGGAKKAEATTKTYILDTSVLLSDPKALFKFKEQEVVIPIIVINELEKKRHDPEIGYYARQALRHLDDLRTEHERLDFPMQVGDGGILRVELNHIDQSVLPAGFQLGDNDSRILACAFNLSREGKDVTVVSKDLPMRVKAAALGMAAEEYRNDNAVDSGWTGTAEISLTADEMSDLWDTEIIKHKDVANMPVNTGLIINSERGAALGRVEKGGKIKLVRGDRDVFGVKGRSAEQRLACHGPSRGPRGRARAPSAQENHCFPPNFRRRRARAWLPPGQRE
jgi:PhoH-like ATPase